MPEDVLRQALVGRTIAGTSRLGKNCFLLLDDGHVFVLHFGMTGDMGAYRDEADAPRFTRVALHLADSGLRIAFIDPRKFGRIAAGRKRGRLSTSQKNRPRRPGASPRPNCTDKLARRKTLSSPCYSTSTSRPAWATGLWTRCCFRPKSIPSALANSLSAAEVKRLHAAIQLVLTTAIAQEANYRNFPTSFLIHAREWDESATPGTDAHRSAPATPTQPSRKTTWAAGQLTSARSASPKPAS